jgi:hypothetical protein
MLAGCGRRTQAIEAGKWPRRHAMPDQPTLMFDADPSDPGSASVAVRNLGSDLTASLGSRAQAGLLLQSLLRVRVVEARSAAGEELPDVYGRYRVLEDGLRFKPYFPFEAGVRFRATFDPRQLGRPELSEVLTLEFSLPRERSRARARVKHVFPSGDALPENLLRFYACFSRPMQRGWAEKQIKLLSPDGQPASDVLYRPPVELWDRSMRCLTILLDPGRLKRGVGPYRELGPPLKAGLEYTLVIGSGMVDASGRTLGKSFHKAFHVTEPVREPIAIEQWRIRPPAAGGRQPLTLSFPSPLDWALLWHAITVASEGGQPIHGEIAIDRCEGRWRFTPTSPWAAGSYDVHIAASLEDACGNSPLGAFDRPLRSGPRLAFEAASRSIPFQIAR